VDVVEVEGAATMAEAIAMRDDRAMKIVFDRFSTLTPALKGLSLAVGTFGFHSSILRVYQLKNAKGMLLPALPTGGLRVVLWPLFM